ncbi:MAG: signal peptidase II [Myxococcales bacterium]|nr:MAG: signal peptidase II [Myxococcales bacterium]
MAFLVAALGLVTDQVTKVLAVERLSGEPPRPLVGEFLQLNLIYNPGAAFGLGGGFTVVFALLALVATCVAVWFALKVRTPAWAIAVGLVIAGVGGNLIDRIVRAPGPFHGHVVDFLQLPNWPIFNVADICINAGAILIIIQFIRGVNLDGTREGQEAKA